MGLILPAVAVACAACVLFALRELSAARALPEGSWLAVAGVLRRRRAVDAEALADVLGLASVRGAARDLVTSVAAARSRPEVVGALNEAVADLQADLSARAGVARAAARIAVATGAAGGLVALSEAVRPASSLPLAVPLGSFAVGAAGGLASALVARLAAGRRARGREAVAAALEQLGRAGDPLGAGAVDSPGRPG